MQLILGQSVSASQKRATGAHIEVRDGLAESIRERGGCGQGLQHSSRALQHAARELAKVGKLWIIEIPVRRTIPMVHGNVLTLASSQITPHFGSIQ